MTLIVARKIDNMVVISSDTQITLPEDRNLNFEKLPILKSLIVNLDILPSLKEGDSY